MPRRANALVVAGIDGAEEPEEPGHRGVLVLRARKVAREAARGETTGDLGVIAGRTADTSDIGTCENTTVQ
jgi:hypothetical protein